MKPKNFLGIVLLISSVMFPSTAFCDLVKTTWQFTISSPDHIYGTHADNVFDVGDTAFISLFYDDSTGIMHDYGDGADGISWTADDTIFYTYDLTDPAYAAYDMFADVYHFTCSDNITEYLYGGSQKNIFDAPVSRISHNIPYDELQYIFRDDASYIRLMRNHSNSVISVKTNTEDFTYTNEIVGTLVSVTTTPVPVPGTVLLAGMGFGITAYFRRKKQL